MDTNLELLSKIEELESKWRNKEPIKYSALYWRFRADQLYIIALKSKLEKKLETTKNV